MGVVRGKWFWIVLCIIAGWIAVTVRWIWPAISLATASPLERERILARREGIPIDPADLRQLAACPESGNAASTYQAAFAALRADRTLPWGSVTNVLSGKYSAADLKSVRSLLRRHARDLDAVDRASRMPCCDFHYDWDNCVTLVFPECAKARQVALLLSARALILSHEGRPDLAFASIATGARLAHHFGRVPALIPALVDVAIQAILDRSWYRILREHPRDTALLAAAEAAANEFTPVDTVNCLASEVPSSHVLYCQLREGKDPMNPGAKPKKVSKGDLAFCDNGELQTVRFWRRVVNGLPGAHHNPLFEYEVVKRECDAVGQDSTRADTKILRILVPVYPRACLKFAAADARHALRVTALGLLRYCLQTGRYPARLSDLRPAPQPDPLANAPLHYHRTPDGFVLYSVGENLRDDGGKTAAKNPPDIVVTFP